MYVTSKFSKWKSHLNLSNVLNFANTFTITKLFFAVFLSELYVSSYVWFEF